MVRKRCSQLSRARRAAVLVCLRRYGPLTSAELARLLEVKPAAMNQWMTHAARKYRDWVRMPNMRYLLLEEEPVGKTFDSLPLGR